MGWHSFDQSLLKAYKADQITDETALIFCAQKQNAPRHRDGEKLRNLIVDEPSDSAWRRTRDHSFDGGVTQPAISRQ